MARNLGSIDAGIRGAIGVALLLVAAGLMQWALLSILLLIVAIALLRTALTRSCPLYSLLGIDTARNGGKRHGDTAASKA